MVCLVVYTRVISNTEERETMNTNTITKALYMGMEGGEVTCIKCAGHSLKSSIQNAKANQVRFQGLNGEFYVLTSEQELGMPCEYC
jgi:hypothetical protein